MRGKDYQKKFEAISDQIPNIAKVAVKKLKTIIAIRVEKTAGVTSFSFRVGPKRKHSVPMQPEPEIISIKKAVCSILGRWALKCMVSATETAINNVTRTAFADFLISSSVL
ncbi:MAG: hypothetical protein NT108_00360 [Candidatus Kaiserbacteria bacterium]|nr:hypothetical protein [Candidatus Kaiserbacteria bacterium]